MCLTFHFDVWQWGNEEVCRLFWNINTHTNEMRWNEMEKRNIKSTKTAHQLSVRIMWRRNKVVCWNKEMQRIEMKTLNIGNVFIVWKWMYVCVCGALPPWMRLYSDMFVQRYSISSRWLKPFNDFHTYGFRLHFICSAALNSQFKRVFTGVWPFDWLTPNNVGNSLNTI